MKLVLFGGKGGVGKTTCAAAAALELAAAGHRTLLASTDPAHSLSDALEQEIGPDIQAVKGVRNLFALEISAERLFLKFKEDHGQELRHLVETGTYLNAEDLDDLSSLSIPGLDEVMALKELVDLVERGEYEYYLLDTAPTGHALRLLALPDLVEQWIRVLARLRYKYRMIIGRIAHREIHEPADDLLFALKRGVRCLDELLHDPERCEFLVVTLPEAMVIAETGRLIEELGRQRIPVRHLVVNHVVSAERVSCPFCHERWQGQRRLLQESMASFTALKVFQLLERARPIRGLAQLRELGFQIPWPAGDPAPAVTASLEDCAWRLHTV